MNRLYVFTFGSGYICQQAVVMAHDEHHALQLLYDAMSKKQLSFKTIVNFSENELQRDSMTGAPLVEIADGPIFLTYGVDG